MVDWSSEIRARLAPLALSPEREFEIAEELGQHLEDRYAELHARGASDADAQRTVRDELQRAPLLDALASAARTSPRDDAPPPGTQGGTLLASLGRDVRYGAR